MSHFTKITSRIKDLEVLDSVVKRMGYRLEKNGHCRYFYGAERRDVVIKLPGAYDVGLTKEGSHYMIDADFYGNNVSRYVGAGCSKLMQQYAVEKARMEAFKHGLGVTEKKKNDSIVLNFVDPNSGGEISVECLPDGNSEVKTSGFAGQSCMKFRAIEEALGLTSSLEYTDEFYVAESENVSEYIQTSY